MALKCTNEEDTSLWLLQCRDEEDTSLWLLKFRDVRAIAANFASLNNIWKTIIQKYTLFSNMKPIIK